MSEAQTIERAPCALYFSARDHGWTPPGVRMPKGLDPCSMTPDSTKRYLGSWAADANVIEAVAWFDEDGAAHVIVADFDSGQRIIVRQLSRCAKVTFSRWRDAMALTGSPQ